MDSFTTVNDLFTVGNFVLLVHVTRFFLQVKFGFNLPVG